MRRRPTSQSPVVAPAPYAPYGLRRTERTVQPNVAVELRGDGPAVEHLATSTEAVNHRMATHMAHVICSPDPGEQYLPRTSQAVPYGNSQYLPAIRKGYGLLGAQVVS
eukprot:4797526-Prymnesium_polylepis.1